MIRLDGLLVSSLLKQPESGMGYQLVEADLQDGRRQQGVAYNGELLLFENEPRVVLKGRTYEALLKGARESTRLVKALRVRRSTPHTSSSVKEDRRSGEAKDAPVERTADGDVFKRFSAYANDRRVTADRRLLPGTYATTEKDAQQVRTGSDAVRRYALPNPEPASWVFTSRPDADAAIQRGTVAPAYGQPGGGVEVIFPDGTQAQTTTGPLKIPD